VRFASGGHAGSKRIRVTDVSPTVEPSRLVTMLGPNGAGKTTLLEPRRDVRAALLSGGEQQMLVVARALACRPKVLMLDEMSQGQLRQLMPDWKRVVRWPFGASYP
jgi:ABC-type branched-subunit amino acid transport system ATPase component